jgi:hypothetical protein
MGRPLIPLIPYTPYIPYTLPEMLRLIWSLVWQQVVHHAQAVAWSLFRRHHQAIAQVCHYERRLALNTS